MQPGFSAVPHDDGISLFYRVNLFVYTTKSKMFMNQAMKKAPPSRDCRPSQTLYLGQAACVSLGTTRNIPKALKSPAAPPKEKVASGLTTPPQEPSDHRGRQETDTEEGGVNA